MHSENDNFIRKTIRGFYFAGRGIVFFLKAPSNAWIHILAACFACGSGFYFCISRWEWCAVVVAIGGVLVAEMFNTAVELLVDLVSPGFNEKAGRIKDIAAGAVLVASIGAAMIGAVVFIPKLLLLL
jgi:diacylglycerol kinase (ATP)